MSTEPLAAVLSEHMARRDLSLRELSDRLAALGAPVSPAALSFWRSGRRRPEGATSLDAVERLEEIFELPPGELTSRMGPSRRRPRPAPLRADSLRHPEITERLFAELGFDFADLGLVEVTLNTTVDVYDGCMIRITTRTIFRATTDGVHRFPLYLEGLRPREEPYRYHVVHGCALGRQVRDDRRLVQAVEVLLDRPLAAGETAVTEVAVEGLQTTPDDRFMELQARRRIRDLALWVRFHGDLVPARAWRYSVLDPDPVELAVHGSGLHAEAGPYGPGVFGIRWEW